jgi:phospholipase/carboxylesterase
MNMKAARVRCGDLNCVQIDSGGPVDVLVVALHGFGAPGDDLVAFAEVWYQLLGPSSSSVRFLFPEAPLSLTELGIPGGRAWWELNMERLMQAVEANSIAELRSHEPPGIDAVRATVTRGLEEMLEELGLSHQQLILGGFSQGAMLSTDVALRGLAEPPGGLFLYSGTLICEAAWSEAARRLQQTPVVQSHGRQDPILPFRGAEALRGMLTSAGVEVQFHEFAGGHSTDMGALESTAELIRGRAADRASDGT